MKATLPLGVALRLAVVIVNLVAAFFPVGIYFYADKALVTGAEHGQQVMRRDFGDGLAEAEVAAVFGGVRGALPCLGYLGNHPARAVNAAKVFPHSGRFAKALCQDVPRALQGVFHVLHLPLDEAAGIGLRVPRLAGPKKVCQRFQALCHRHRSPRFAFGPIREIKVFQLAGNEALFYLFAKLFRKFSLLLDSAKDGGLALFHLFINGGPMLYLCHFHVCETAGALLAVPADKRNGAPVVKKLYAVLHLPGLNPQ